MMINLEEQATIGDLQGLEIDTFEVEELGSFDVDASVDVSLCSSTTSSSSCSSCCSS
jgi:hypothetical protein